MNVDKYKSSGRLERTFGVVRLLFGHTVHGLTSGEVAAGARISPANATRTLAQLKHIGVVEEIRDSGRWRLGPWMVQGAMAHLHDLKTAEHDIAEIQQRYSRRPD